MGGELPRPLRDSIFFFFFFFFWGGGVHGHVNRHLGN